LAQMSSALSAIFFKSMRLAPLITAAQHIQHIQEGQALSSGCM
jgi:hypothetical protein